MSQLQLAAASINNGGTTITCGAGTVLIGNVAAGHRVQFDGENAIYSVASTPIDNISIPIVGIYAGTNKINALLDVWRDMTATTGLPALNASDRGWAFSLANWQAAVETVLGGWRASFMPCKWSTTTAPTGTYNPVSKQFTYTATGALSDDGGSPVVNDRILVRHGSYQGIYYVLNAGGVGVQAVLQRAVDMYSTAIQGATVWVMAGTGNALTQWYLSTAAPIIIDTSTIAWTSIPFYGTAPIISGSSVTSLTIGTGSQTLTTNTGMTLTPGQAVTLVNDSTHYMGGFITSYTSGTGVLIVTVPTGAAVGTGTFSSWVISLAGNPGPIGGQGTQGNPGISIQGEQGEQGDDGWPIPGPVGPKGATGLPAPLIPGIDGIDGEDAMPIPSPPASLTTATTQSPQNNTTAVATTAYADASWLPIYTGTTYSATIAAAVGALGKRIINEQTAMSGACTINAPTGTPQNGQMIEYIFTDNSTPRALTWTGGAGGTVSSGTITLPTTTVASTELHVLVQYKNTGQFSGTPQWVMLGQS